MHRAPTFVCALFLAVPALAQYSGGGGSVAVTCASGLTCSGGAIALDGVTPTAAAGSPASTTRLLASDGTYWTIQQLVASGLFGSGGSSTLTAATLSGIPTTGTAGTALTMTGASASLTPTGASAYAVLHDGTADQAGGRTTFTGTTPPTLTPAAAGSFTYKLYAASAGGTALATSPTITVGAGGASINNKYTVTAGAYPPATSLAFGGNSYTSAGGQFYLLGTGGITPTSVDIVTYTRSNTVVPTSGSGANQYGSNNQEANGATLYGGSNPGMWQTSSTSIWKKGSAPGGDWTYYMWIHWIDGTGNGWVPYPNAVTVSP